jgi:hypothetical protein
MLSKLLFKHATMLHQTQLALFSTAAAKPSKAIKKQPKKVTVDADTVDVPKKVDEVKVVH